MHSDNNDFEKLLNTANRDTNIFFSFANKCFRDIKETKPYNFLDFYNRMTKIVYGKSLFENDFIKELIFECIYSKSKGINFKLPENFDTNDFSQNLEPYEIEFLNFILTEYSQLGEEQNKSKISDWYKNVNQKEKVTYVEKTFLLQINGEINFFDLNFSQNVDIDIYDNEGLSKVNLCKLLNDHFQSGADSRLMNNPNNFLLLYNKIIDILSKDKIVIEKQDSKIVEIEITKKIKQDLIYRMFELCSGSEYYTIKKNKDSYCLFKCRGNGEFLSELEFNNIVRTGNHPSFFAHIFELEKENRDEAVQFLLEQLNEMLKDKSIDKIDKASILLPFFINENISGIRVNLYDKLLSEYKNNKEINSLIKNIFKRSKEYFPEGYLKKYLIQKEGMKKVAKAAVKLVKASEEKERKKVKEVMKKVVKATVKATVKSAAEEKVEQTEEEVQKVEKEMILRAQELKEALEKEAAAVTETLEAFKRSVEVAEELKKALEKKEAAKKVAEAVKEVAKVVKEAVKTTVKEEVKQIIEEARKRREEDQILESFVSFFEKAEEEEEEEAARKKAEEEAARKAEEEERLRKEEEAKRQAEEEARRQVEEEAKRQAEEEARRQAEEERKKAEKERLEKEKEEKDKAVEEFLESILKKPETNSVNNTQSVNRTPGKPTQEKSSISKKPLNTSTKVAKLKIFFEEEAVKSANR